MSPGAVSSEGLSGEGGAAFEMAHCWQKALLPYHMKLHWLLECPHDVAACFPWSKQSEREQGGHHGDSLRSHILSLPTYAVC